MKVWAVEERYNYDLQEYWLYLDKEKAQKKVDELVNQHDFQFVPGYYIKYEDDVAEWSVSLTQNEVIE